MAGLVLGALTQASDRTPWLAALFADRFARRGLVLAAALVALSLNYAAGVVGGVLVGALLTPEAKLLLLALALLLAGIGTAIRTRAPDALEGWRVGPATTAFAGLAIMVFGDRMQFIVAALAGRSTLPWAAAAGAVCGALAVNVLAVAIGARGWATLPLAAIRIGAAIVLTVSGVVLALMATGLL